MGCMYKESCPALFIHNLLEWDPKGKSLGKVSEIRDDIEQRVRQLATDLVKGSPQIRSANYLPDGFLSIASFPL
jgi:hypothetical protein